MKPRRASPEPQEVGGRSENRSRRFFRPIGLLCLLTFPTLSGCRPMLYPLARAFGGPKESQLETIRPAFAVLEARARSGRVLVYPPLVIAAGEPRRDERAGALLVEALQKEIAPHAALASAAPDVPFEPMGKNQMRYLWKRANAYASWVGSRHPDADYLVFTELLTDASGERVLGAQCYFVDASGQIAHAQLRNSHHYDPAALSNLGAFLDWMVRDLRKALARDPLDEYPPYGVG